MSGEPKQSYTTLGLLVGADWSVLCHTYPHRPPILVVDAGNVSMSIAARGDAPDAGHIDFAYKLLAAVNDYLIAYEKYQFESQEAADAAAADDVTAPRAA
ncbi:hypothetical protein Ga0074812_101488 [Parafrankia irregularis]|uniref:Uncharacterized protein n=1 Tax=Parafrankia irregularis TaxID=795642 RepID=A0A0S4QFP2_9ACTN|nr:MULTISPECIES: hypothetical protein [Parafrankia]MBE3206520.1 hypothetical protein [Parafrankia sp. CH37]CUU53986.1 hypothetical protein Ga0074812_101488 [Parafrankia irregularis]